MRLRPHSPWKSQKTVCLPFPPGKKKSGFVHVDGEDEYTYARKNKIEINTAL